jgi:pyruvate dehydrogenase (quinone)
MAKSVADFVLARLVEWGVHRIFGYPGDGINGFLGALEHADGNPEFVQVRHEEMSAFMACGHAKFTGELGVCLATSGPGAIHLLNGLYDAKLDRQPVLAIVGQQKRMSLGSDYQQEVDLQTLFKDVSEYVQVCTTPEQARHLVDRAVRIALDSRGVTTLIFPNDVRRRMRSRRRPASTARSSPASAMPGPESCRRRASSSARRPSSTTGTGLRCSSVRERSARRTRSRRSPTRSAPGLLEPCSGVPLSDDLPFVTGSIGLLGTRATFEMMRDCDTLLMVGSSFPYSDWLPKEGQARGVQIDLSGRMLSLRYPMEVNLLGDAEQTLKALVPLLRRKDDRSWREQIERSVADWWGVVERRAGLEADPINPQQVYWELNSRLPDHAIVTGDSGSNTVWWARTLRLRQGMAASVSGTLASMGSAVPYALAAKFAYPGRPVIAFLGDGAFQMNGMNELLTVAKYWERWGDPRLTICVLNNRDLNMVTWEQRVLAGDPKLPATQEIPDFPAARFAELVGLRGIRVERPAEVAGAWDEALASDRPTVLEAIVDPDVPPLPPHVGAEEARNLAEALVKGDPDRVDVMRKSLREKMAELLPGR